MKRQFIKLTPVMAIFALLFTACQEESIAPHENSITTAIEKIETSYVEADVKELTFDGEKAESRASADFIKKWIQMQIEEDNGSMKRYTNSKLAETAYDVGVIPNTTSVNNFCPKWAEKITIFMDCEDNHAATKWGWFSNTKLSWQVTSSKDVILRFCRVDGRLFSKIKNDYYAVLQLGTIRPPGSREIARTLDNEDNSNSNYSVGNISPNIQNQYSTRLYFWAFDKSASAPVNTFPALGFPYGVFANEETHIGDWPSYHWTNKVLIDDEDRANANTMYVEDGTNFSPANFGLFAAGDPNTTITFHRVK